MVQSILFFALGFLCAGFLTLMIAPSIWRRAVSLTQRRMEASLPMSVNELQAEKDRLRAEHAMTARRLEIGIKDLREKSAGLTIDLNRKREELKKLGDERAEQERTIAGLETDGEELRADLGLRAERIRQLEGELAEAMGRLEQQLGEMEQLARAYDDASFASSSRQIEIVARETEIDKLATDIAEQREKNREAERKARDVATELAAARDELKHEKHRSREYEARMERLVSNLSDRDEKLERRERELERLRAKIASGPAEEGHDSELEALQAQNSELEARVSELSAELAALKERVADASPDAGSKDNASLKRLQARLTTMTRENKRLRAELTGKGVGPGRRTRGKDGDQALREQIAELAAEMVHLTATLEGQSSPILASLKAAETQGAAGPSLAQRVRALQELATPSQDDLSSSKS